MGRYTEIPSTLPSGDPGVKLFSEPRTVDAVDVQVTAVINVDPTDPKIQQAVDATYGAAVDVTRLPGTAATAANQTTGNASLAAIASAAGATTDAEAASGDGSWIAILKAIRTKLGSIYTALTGTLTVSGSVSTGGLTNAELRGSAVPISASALPLPSDAATQTTLALVKAKTDNLDVAASTLATATAQTTGNASLSSLETRAGSVTETAPATDTASSGLNGRLQRIAQRLTSLIALLPSAIGQTTKAGSLSVSVASDDDMVGSKTETAPASDTASSGLNGRLQRVAQRITSLIALLPTSLGQKAMSASLAVTVASDQPKALPRAYPGQVDQRDNYTSAQTNVVVVAGPAAGYKVLILSQSIATSASCTAKPQCIVGFGATTPTATKVVNSHPGVPPGGGIRQDNPKEGGESEPLRATLDAPTGGSLTLLTSWVAVPI